MNAPHKTLIAAFSLLAISALPIISLAASIDDIQQRVKKVGRLNVSDEAAAPAAATDTADTADSGGGATAIDGATLYQSNCFACHGTGAAGAPIVGKADIWAPRIAQGEDTLIQHAINGLNAMPPRGGTTLDDDSIKAVVAYMVEQSK